MPQSPIIIQENERALALDQHEISEDVSDASLIIDPIIIHNNKTDLTAQTHTPYYTINYLKSTNKPSTPKWIGSLPLIEIPNECRNQQNSWQPKMTQDRETPMRNKVDKINNSKSSEKAPIQKWIGSLSLIETPNDDPVSQSSRQSFFSSGRSNKHRPSWKSRKTEWLNYLNLVHRVLRKN